MRSDFIANGVKVVVQSHDVIDDLSKVVSPRQGLLEERVLAGKRDVSELQHLSIRAVGPIGKLVLLGKTIVD